MFHISLQLEGEFFFLNFCHAELCDARFMFVPASVVVYLQQLWDSQHVAVHQPRCVSNNVNINKKWS